MDGLVGNLNWQACDTCKYYRPDEGGCQFMDYSDTVVKDLFIINVEMDEIYCMKYKTINLL